MILRAARTADAAAIAAIWNPVIRDTLFTFTTTEKSAADVATLIATARAAIVAEHDGAIAGFALLDPFRPGPGYARTLEVSVHLAPAARGKGTGRSLVDRLAGLAASQNAGSLWAAVSGKNPTALDFFERVGFAPVAVLPGVGWKNDRWLDLHLLCRRVVIAPDTAAATG